MAVKLITWTRDLAILKMARYFGKDKKDEPIVIEAEFDLAELLPKMFPGTVWEDLAEFGKDAFTYLVKQKLMDTGASSIGDTEGKVQGAKRRWTELMEEKWTGERVNATGAAANKKMVASMKETAKAVTLEGLVMKKAMAKFPGQPEFTEDDQKKLDELMLAAAKIAAGEKNEETE